MNAFTRKLAAALCGAAVVCLAASAGELSGQDKAMMIEAARADLYAQIARQIKGLSVSENTLVANHVTADSTRDASTSALIKGATVGEPEFLEDVCVLNGSITLNQVVENLRASVRTDAAGREISYENLRRHNEQVTLHAQGVGTRRKPPGAPAAAGATEDDTGLKAAVAALKGPGQDKLGAIEAARIDALAQLARQIKGVRVSDESLVYNMALDGRWTETSSNALIKGARVVRYAAMEGDLVSCVMSITLEQIVENVQRSRTEFADGSSISQEKIRRYNPELLTLTATGYGAVGKGRMGGEIAPGRIIGSVE